MTAQLPPHGFKYSCLSSGGLSFLTLVRIVVACVLIREDVDLSLNRRTVCRVGRAADVGFTLHENMSSLCEKMEDAMENGKALDVRFVIHKHAQYCDILLNINEMINRMTAVYYLFQLTVTTITFYIGIYGEGLKIVKYAFIYVGIGHNIVFAFSVLLITEIPKTMHRFRSQLELLFFRQKNINDQLMIISYRKRLGKCPPGITVGGIFTITRKSIPKIMQSMQSYFSSLIGIKKGKDACGSVLKQFSI
ncbi:uncharacterized protein LOC111618130 [Centruroides sculpturatus]|uniref:uncharacterized protein LOC111618130 n=1 Tax=Centruroides sculpturatus TaxID=218467 RepID=UPI000C6C9DD0|nr:uncharacterized protein LOC111618130 [Centruroides sculpturatus]